MGNAAHVTVLAGFHTGLFVGGGGGGGGGGDFFRTTKLTKSILS